ncbi:hypothetical protein [Phaeobacter sp. B1627]|uniref:hypothetical protein n=1 Tax=Phaeobacter sp. B1627 TaxID=2583809 RepID=UPI002107B506|nr:hypothetical protein [Phaeobacter sp. B1627]
MKMHAGFTLSLIVAAGLGLTACGSLKEDRRPKFNGVPFKATVKAIDKRATLADFRVEVGDATRSQLGALQAADHEAKRYCIENFGTSRFDWTNITVDAEGAYSLQLDRGDGIFTGTCKP